MKNFRIDIFEWLLYLMTALSTGVFLVFSISLDTCRSVLTVVLCFFLFLFYANKKNSFNDLNKYLITFFKVYSLILFIYITVSIFIYKYSVYDIFYSLRQYMWVYASLPLYIMMKKDNRDKIINNVLNITFFSLILRTVTWLVFVLSDVVLFKDVLYEYNLPWGRNGLPRIDATPLIGILIIFSLYFYLKSGKLNYLFKLFFSICYLLIITQTRMLILGAFFSLLVMFFSLQKNKKHMKYLVYSMLVLMILFFAFGGMDKILHYLDLSSGISGLGYRYYEFEYFFGLLNGFKWVTGLGILTSSNPIGKEILFGNLETQMFLDDLGFFESFIQFGIFAIVMYGMIYLFFLKVLKYTITLKKNLYTVLLAGMFSYIFFVSIPLNLFGIQRSFSIIFILSVLAIIDDEISTNLVNRR